MLFPLALLLASFALEAPHIPPIAPAPVAPTPDIDPKAQSLLAANEKAMIALRSYSAECFRTRTFAAGARRPKEYTQSKLIAVKPNLMRYETVGLDKSVTGTFTKSRYLYPTTIRAVDGKQAMRQFGNLYLIDDHVSPMYVFTLPEPWGGFYTADASFNTRFAHYQNDNDVREVRYIGRETIEGVSCDVIAYRCKSSDQAYEGKLFIGPDHLIRRQLETTTLSSEPSFTDDAVLRRIKTNFAPPPVSTFAYTSPLGVK